MKDSSALRAVHATVMSVMDDLTVEEIRALAIDPWVSLREEARSLVPA